MAKLAYILASALLLVFIFVSPAVAASFSRLPNNGVLISGETNYRQKTASRSWQKSSANIRVTEPAVYWDSLYWVVGEDDSGQGVWTTEGGLKYSLVFRPEHNATLRLVQTGKVLFLALGQTSDNQLFIWNNDRFLATALPATFSFAQLDWLTDENGMIFLPIPVSGQTTMYRLDGLSWLPEAVLGCSVASQPIAELSVYSCENGELWRWQVDIWQKLQPAQNLLVASWRLIVSQSAGEKGKLVLIDPSDFSDTEIILPEEARQLAVFGQRVLVKQTAGWQELTDWRSDSPFLTPIIGADAQTILSSDKEQIGLKEGQTIWLASATTQESATFPFTASATNIERLSAGWLVWQTAVDKSSGGLAHFCSSATTTCQKVNPWSSTTSPVQDVLAGQPNLVLVRTSSQRLNLYSSMDGQSWSRITLPETPTFSVSISDARQLSAGSLLETEGIITVLPGVTGDDRLYIEDGTAGIQVYLSASKGSLPQLIYRRVIVTGEISSAAVKRITLDGASALEIKEERSLTHPTVELTAVGDYLGRVVRLRGLIESLNTGDFSFGLLKVHLAKAKQQLHLGDTASITALVDFNSASGKTEGWAIGLPSEIEPAIATSSQTSNQPSTSKPVARSTDEGSTSAVLVKSAKTVKPVSSVANQLPDSSSRQQDQQRSRAGLSLLSLLAGALAARGSRFSRLFTSG